MNIIAITLDYMFIILNCYQMKGITFTYIISVVILMHQFNKVGREILSALAGISLPLISLFLFIGSQNWLDRIYPVMSPH